MDKKFVLWNEGFDSGIPEFNLETRNLKVHWRSREKGRIIRRGLNSDSQIQSKESGWNFIQMSWSRFCGTNFRFE